MGPEPAANQASKQTSKQSKSPASRTPASLSACGADLSPTPPARSLTLAPCQTLPNPANQFANAAACGGLLCCLPIAELMGPVRLSSIRSSDCLPLPAPHIPRSPKSPYSYLYSTGQSEIFRFNSPTRMADQHASASTTASTTTSDVGAVGSGGAGAGGVATTSTSGGGGGGGVGGGGLFQCFQCKRNYTRADHLARHVRSRNYYTLSLHSSALTLVRLRYFRHCDGDVWMVVLIR